MFKVPEKYRIKTGKWASTQEDGNNGLFVIPFYGIYKGLFIVIASDGLEWEHVSVHVEINKKIRTPFWDEMCKMKDLFWDKEDCVVQYHPSELEYVNNHPNTLHLWRPTKLTIPIPLKEMVGIKTI